MLSKEDRLQYAKQSLDGLALGDCFGQTFFENEKKAYDRIAKQQIYEKPWTFTDDTVMGIGIYHILKECGEVKQDRLAEIFGKNYLLDWHRGYGGTAHSILRAIGEGENWREVAPKVFDGMGSMGNGAAMRVAPIGAYFADDLEKVVYQARLSAEITHSHREGIAGAVAVAVAAAQLKNKQLGKYTASPKQFLEDIASEVPESDTKYKILTALSIKKESHIDFVVSVLGNGIKLTSQDTVPFALWCAAYYHESLADSLWRAVSALGDRDTICAIVGGIVAVYNNQVPDSWIKYMEKPEETEFFPHLLQKKDNIL